jgi:hypothetical protein
MARPATQYFHHEGMNSTLYTFESAGDEIAMHAHNFAHLSIPIKGRFLGYDGEGREVAFEAGGLPVEFLPDHKHAIRALDDGAVLLNMQRASPSQTTTVFEPVVKSVTPNTANVVKRAIPF